MNQINHPLLKIRKPENKSTSPSILTYLGSPILALFMMTIVELSFWAIVDFLGFRVAEIGGVEGMNKDDRIGLL